MPKPKLLVNYKPKKKEVLKANKYVLNPKKKIKNQTDNKLINLPIIQPILNIIKPINLQIINPITDENKFINLPIINPITDENKFINLPVIKPKIFISESDKFEENKNTKNKKKIEKQEDIDQIIEKNKETKQKIDNLKEKIQTYKIYKIKEHIINNIDKYIILFEYYTNIDKIFNIIENESSTLDIQTEYKNNISKAKTILDLLKNSGTDMKYDEILQNIQEYQTRINQRNTTNSYKYSIAINIDSLTSNKSIYVYLFKYLSNLDFYKSILKNNDDLKFYVKNIKLARQISDLLENSNNDNNDKILQLINDYNNEVNPT